MTQAENTPAEFVDLLNHADYEILNVYPFTIRRKDIHHVVKVNLSGEYPRVALNGKPYLKHRLIALQFLPNPNNLPEVDHINRDRTDYHLSNLRWVSSSDNQRNKASHKGVQYRYVDEISPEALVVDYYETRTERHYFKDYYYHEGVFYYDTDMNYRVLNINSAKNGTRYVYMKSNEGKLIAVVINRFLDQHDML